MVYEWLLSEIATLCLFSSGTVGLLLRVGAKGERG